MSIPPGNCICIQCNTEKDNNEYPYSKRLTKEGFYTRNNRTCKDCCKYNINILNDIKKDNPRPPLGTPCECCNRPIIKSGDFQCDHNHETNEFRGWLCRKCNTGMGLLGDDVEGLLRALKYLGQDIIIKNEEQQWVKISDMKKECKKRGITGFSKLSREELIEILNKL